MNNPMQLFTNPQQFVQGIINNSKLMQNEMFRNGVNMMQKGDIQGLQTLVENIAKERGTSIDEVRKQLGI